MNVIIPAAGIGSRLRPHTHTLPKALLHVAGKPILGHILDIITRLDADEICVITGFMGDDVEKYVRNRYSRPIRFVRQEELLGLGYAVHLALAGLDDRPVLILLGDTIVETDLSDFISRGDNVLGLLPVDNPQRFGIADVSDGVVTRLVEKPDQPQSTLAIIGLYYISTVAGLRKRLDRMIASNQKNQGEFQLTDALQGMIEDGVRFVPYSVDGWYDCGERETLINTNRHLLERLGTTESREGSVIIPPSYIAPTATVKASVIGPYVSVSDRAIIENSIIRNSIIGFQAEVRNALLHDSLVGHRAVVIGDFRAVNVGDSSEVGYF